jgi:adenylate kinase family enzyme
MHLNTYKIIMLGPSGSGKTVFLASLFKRLYTQGELGFFLETDSEQRKKLNSIYTEIALDERWPRGTRYNEVSEWNFTCRVKTESLSDFAACKFIYLDYSGTRITEVIEEEQDDDEINAELEEQFCSADALLGLLDGEKLLSLFKGERSGKLWEFKDLPNMLSSMQRNGKPIHFVISKWDLLEGKHSLGEVRDRLLKIDEFKNIVEGRNRAGSPVRLIPVSSVGTGFAILQPDGEMKKTGSSPKPERVEAPLACVLPDLLKTALEELIKERMQEEDIIVEVKPNLSFWDKVGQFLGDGLRKIKRSLPSNVQLADDILETIIQYAEEPAQKKQEAAIKRTEDLRRQQVESLKKVYDEETALRHAVNCFMSIKNHLEAQFPESEIKLT